MHAKVVQIDSSDIDVNSYVPENENHFGFALAIHVGSSEGNGADIFQLMVCTPEWFKSNYGDQSAVWGYSFLFVFKYDFPTIKTFITKHIEKKYGNDWSSIAVKIDRYAMWEFQDYRP